MKNMNFNVLIKPVSGSCNMRCAYCFYQDEMRHRGQDNYGRMHVKTLENVVRKFLRSADARCTFGFQGGEPTLAGLDFYQELMRLERMYNVRAIEIENALQTNGYAVTPEWAEFFHKHRFLVGLSIDGTQPLHDTWRLDGSASGTYAAVTRTAALFDAYAVDYNVLTVVNALTAAHAREIYESYRSNGWKYLQFIACMDGLEQGAPKTPWSLAPEAYGAFLCEMFDLWYADYRNARQPYIRMFDNCIAILSGRPPESCDMRGVCGLQYLVEADGSVFPCDFYALEECRLGNLNTDRLETIDAKRDALGFVSRSIALPENCKKCPYLQICRNGCYRYRDECGQNRLCAGFRMFFSHTLKRMQRIAASLPGN